MYCSPLLPHCHSIKDTLYDNYVRTRFRVSIPRVHSGASFLEIFSRFVVHKWSDYVREASICAYDETQQATANEQQVLDKDPAERAEFVRPEKTHLYDGGKGDPQGGQTQRAEQRDEQLQPGDSDSQQN